MFDSEKSSAQHIADAADLVIDFATLGEYGLEPVDAPSPRCEGRRRGGSTRSVGTWRSAIDHFAAQH